MSLVFIVVDSLRHDALGYCGGQAVTPTIDRLAQQAVVGERVIAAAPWTVPAIASMMTGVYSHRLGLAKWEQPWPARQGNLFRQARRSGYEVASFVFDPAYLFSGVPEAEVKGSSQDTEALLGWLRAHPQERLLLFIHYWRTHVPYVSTPTTTSSWRQVTDQVLAALRAGEAARAGVRRLYQRAVEHFSEEWFPRLAEVVDLDRSWLLITADHGESWGERPGAPPPRDVFDLHGNTLYDEVLRVPLILRPPRGCPPRRVPQLMRTVDIYPTLLELLELHSTALTSEQLGAVEGHDSSLDGLSLAPLIQGEGDMPAVDAISVLSRHFVDKPMLPEDPADLWGAFALTTQRYKQIWEPQTNRRLAFDLLADPQELRDISGQQCDELDRGWRRLADELTRAQVGDAQAEDLTLVSQRLRQLGYLE